MTNAQAYVIQTKNDGNGLRNEEERYCNLRSLQVLTQKSEKKKKNTLGLAMWNPEWMKYSIGRTKHQ